MTGRAVSFPGAHAAWLLTAATSWLPIRAIRRIRGFGKKGQSEGAGVRGRGSEKIQRLEATVTEEIQCPELDSRLRGNDSSHFAGNDRQDAYPTCHQRSSTSISGSAVFKPRKTPRPPQRICN
jgi:hypothetical protein